MMRRFAGVGAPWNSECGFRVAGIEIEPEPNDLAASEIEDPRFLLPCWGDNETLVDRFDARLLLDSPPKTPTGPAEDDPGTVREELDAWRLRDVDGWPDEDEGGGEGDREDSSDGEDAPGGDTVPVFAFDYGPPGDDGADMDARGAGDAQEVASASLRERLASQIASRTGGAGGSGAGGGSGDSGRVPPNPAGRAPTPPGLVPPDDPLSRANLLRAAEAVAAGGVELERLLRARRAGRPGFGFLQPGHPSYGFWRWAVDERKAGRDVALGDGEGTARESAYAGTSDAAARPHERQDVLHEVLARTALAAAGRGRGFQAALRARLLAEPSLVPSFPFLQPGHAWHGAFLHASAGAPSALASTNSPSADPGGGGELAGAAVGPPASLGSLDSLERQLEGTDGGEVTSREAPTPAVRPP